MGLIISLECPEMLLSSDPTSDPVPANSAKISHYCVLDIQLNLAHSNISLSLMIIALVRTRKTRNIDDERGEC